MCEFDSLPSELPRDAWLKMVDFSLLSLRRTAQIVRQEYPDTTLHLLLHREITPLLASFKTISHSMRLAWSVLMHQFQQHGQPWSFTLAVLLVLCRRIQSAIAQSHLSLPLVLAGLDDKTKRTPRIRKQIEIDLVGLNRQKAEVHVVEVKWTFGAPKLVLRSEWVPFMLGLVCASK